MIDAKIDASEAFRLYEQMGPARSLRKLAEQTGIRLSLLGDWSRQQKWIERLAGNATPGEQSEQARTLANLEREQADLRVRLNEQRDQLADRQREFAAKLSLQRAMYAQRVPLQEEALATQNAVTAAHEALSRHINTATESVYADTLYKAEHAHKVAHEALTTFDQEHADVSTAVLQADRNAINSLQQAIEQQEQQLRTLSVEIEQVIEQELHAGLVRVLTAYQDLYSVLQSDGPMLARMRMHNPPLLHRLMFDLSIDQQQLWNLIQPYADHEDDFRPFLRERQALTNDYLTKLTTGG